MAKKPFNPYRKETDRQRYVRLRGDRRRWTWEAMGFSVPGEALDRWFQGQLLKILKDAYFDHSIEMLFRPSPFTALLQRDEALFSEMPGMYG